MKTFIWNCRGLGNPRTVRELTSLVRSYKPGIVGLLETRTNKIKFDHIRHQLGFKNVFIVDRQGIGGGLALLWKDDVDLNIRNFSNYHIDAWLEGPLQTRMTLFYGSPHAPLRKFSWNLLRTLADMPANPWIVMGDFNEVCFSWERKSNRLKGEWQMKNFRKALQDSGLFDMGFRGVPYTFSNRRMGICETKARLDRAMVSADWFAKFPSSQITHVKTATSDHDLLLMDFMEQHVRSSKKLFKFEPMWLRCSDFNETVCKSWSDAVNGNKPLGQTLQRCSKDLTEWNRSSVGSVRDNIRILRSELEQVSQKERTQEIVLQEQ